MTAASYSVWPEKNNPQNIWSSKLHKSEVQIERGQDKTSSHSQGKQLDQTDNSRWPPGCRVGRFVEDWELRASKPGAACSINYASTLWGKPHSWNSCLAACLNTDQSYWPRRGHNQGWHSWHICSNHLTNALQSTLGDLPDIVLFKKSNKQNDN